MEVHAHTHTERKNFTHYLWEFLMLFLAVFCGFLAENQREHMVERKREKEYLKSMLQDLKSDTATYKRYAKSNKPALDIIDSLIYLLKSPERKLYVNRIYYLAKMFTIRTDLLITNERTYDQMNSSGLLRLIHNQNVSDSVSNYYNSLNLIKNQNERITARVDQYFLSVGKIFDAEIMLKIFKERKAPEDNSIHLLTEDPQAINEFLTRAQYLYGTFSFVQNWGLQRCITAGNLIALIQKEYHLSERTPLEE
jgi:hypothetical protein